MENKQPLLLLIDGNALVHRAYHALPPLTVPKTGEVVGAVYGFALMLTKAINELKPTHAAIAFDRKAPTFRHAVYNQYKAQRPPMDEELVGQLGRVRQVVEAFNIPVFEMDGYEADDILGSLSRQAAQQKLDTVIVTGDADIMQLVNPAVKVFYPRSGGSFSDAVLYDEEAVKNRYGVTPAQIADLKALKGDKSDNIPGVPGVGDVTARKLVNQFGDVDSLISRLDEIEPAKLQTKIKENLEQLKLSHHLATIDAQTPVTLDFDQCCRVTRYDRAKAADLFRELNFNSLVAKLPAAEAAPADENPAEAAQKADAGAAAADTPRDAVNAPSVETADSEAAATEAAAGESQQRLTRERPEIRYSTVKTPAELAALIERLDSAREISLHTGGTSATPMSAELNGIAISPAPGEACYIPLNSPDSLDVRTVCAGLKPILEDPGRALYLHNAKYHMILLHKNGLTVSPAFDSMLGAYLAGDQSLGLKELAFTHLGLEMNPAEAGVKVSAKQISLFESNHEEAAASACAAADLTGRISLWCKYELIRLDLQKLYQEVELPLEPVLAEMEINGIKLDPALLREMSGRLGSQMSELEQKVYAAAGEQFNLNSPQQLGRILFEKMQLPGKKVRGKFSTDASVLEGLADQPIVQSILEYRQLMKLKSTYIDALPELINPSTGRLHSNFNQMRTSTGRLSSSDPNLQNIPVKTELGRAIRKAFVAAPGCVLIAGDYSQIDLRALAHLSGDANLLEAFRQDRDIHSATAAQLFGVSLSEVKPEMRRLAKTVNFGVIYGMSEFGLEQATELSRAEAGKFIKAYFEKYPGVTRYLEATKQQARHLGYVQTLLGHRRYIPEVLSPNRQIREGAERMAINMPVQGTSSDIIKVAMIDLQREMRQKQIRSRLVLQVHDELIFEVPEDELELMSGLIPARMSGAVKLDVPLKVDIKTGTNWGAMD